MRTRAFAAVTFASAALLAAPAPAHAEETWRFAPLKWTWPDRFLNDVEAAGPRDIWAGGGQGEKTVTIPGNLMLRPITLLYVPAKPILQHWNGTSWKSFTPPGMNGEGEITDIEAVAPNDVWAGGFTGSNALDYYLAHWDGTSWTRVTPPAGVKPVAMASHDGVLWTPGSRGGFWSFKDGEWTLHPGPSGHPQATKKGVYSYSDLDRYFWNGTSWIKIPEAPGNSSRTLMDSGEMWAIDRDSLIIYRWDGGDGWEKMPVPAEYASSTSHSLRNAGFPVLSVRVDGLYHHLRWTGDGWTTFSPPAASHPHTFTPSSDGTTVYALGPASRHTGTGWEPLPLEEGYRHISTIPDSPYAVFWGTVQGGLSIATNAP